MIKVFVDSDVIMDILIERSDKQLSKTSIKCIDYLIEEPDYTLYTSPLVLANINYLITKSFSKADRLNHMRNLVLIFNVTVMNEATVKSALAENEIKDLEDLFQQKSALQSKVDIFLTRNVKHYPLHPDLQIETPIELLVRKRILF